MNLTGWLVVKWGGGEWVPLQVCETESGARAYAARPGSYRLHQITAGSVSPAYESVRVHHRETVT